MRMKTRSVAFGLILVLGLGLGSSLGVTDAKIVSLKVGADKGVSQESDTFGQRDTIYATARVAGVTDPVAVKAQLVVEDIPGIEPGPIKGLESSVNMVKNGAADFSFSAPTKGWPKGKYVIEVVVLNGNGDEMDHKTARFVVEE